MSKACKSDECSEACFTMTSGKRESNALVIHLGLVNNPEKFGLIHDTMGGHKSFPLKDLSDREKPMYYQLVGEVKAHQGYDGYRV